MAFSSYIELSPFTIKVETNCSLVKKNLTSIYQDALINKPDVVDYHVSINSVSGLRSYLKPQIVFQADKAEPFKPLPYAHGFAMLEWGLNWLISSNELTYVIIHSAVLAKGDKAILFPAPPGSGKSTLTAYLAAHGWRLLSDEMALILPNTNLVVPSVRPICLKNKSIELAKQWYSEEHFSTVAPNTHKGDVVHLRPPTSSWVNRKVPAEIKGIIFPTYSANSETEIYQLNHTQSFMEFAKNAFNYGVIGEKGFNTLVNIIEQSTCLEVKYSDLEDLRAFLEEEIL